tara:strand:- start:882 stop:1334 length:453 start_codon:yes stop_codon:yes gene_type:complete
MNSKNLIDIKIGLLLWKASNLWQSKLRNVLEGYNLTLNEFIILETLFMSKDENITQVFISKSSGVNVSVISTVIKVLQKKSLIKRKSDIDNRKKIIELSENGKILTKKILPYINNVEKNIFLKLGKEEINFVNSMKLILGKKIRIKAEKK